jgi:flagellar basal-body rod protein FlgC
MAGFSIFDISGRAMSAQLVRLNTSASNLANAGSVSSSADTAYQARKPVFQTMLDANDMATVRVARIETVQSEAIRRYEPGHPLADENGYIFEANVDPTAEMVEMLETARQYQNNVEVMQTAKNLVTATLRLGQ